MQEVLIVGYLSKVGGLFSNRDCADMSSHGEFQRCVTPESVVDIGMLLRLSRLRLLRSLTQVINDQVRNDEAETHHQDDYDCGHAVGDCRA